jgi:hypothetical protein
MKRTFLFLFVALVGLGVLPQTAKADLLSTTFSLGTNNLVDGDAEAAFSTAPFGAGFAFNSGATTTNTLNVGTWLVSVIGFNQINGTKLLGINFPQLGSTYQATAVVALQVATKVDTGMTVVINGVTQHLFNFTFTSGFADGQTTIAVYENSGVTSATSIQTGGAGLTLPNAITTRAQSGSLIARIGFPTMTPAGGTPAF